MEITIRIAIPSIQLEPRYDFRSSGFGEERYLTMASLVKPQRSISTNAAGVTNSTHLPKSAMLSILIRIIKDSNPITAEVKFAARDKKLRSCIIRKKYFFNDQCSNDGYNNPFSVRD